jgi:hypothetical protein
MVEESEEVVFTSSALGQPFREALTAKDRVKTATDSESRPENLI